MIEENGLARPSVVPNAPASSAGVRRKAYRRGDDWTDGVLYELGREDLER